MTISFIFFVHYIHNFQDNPYKVISPVLINELYISTTPSINSINFYFKRGASLTKELNPELFELEPEEIHLDLEI